jgi:hypothetical protein
MKKICIVFAFFGITLFFPLSLQAEFDFSTAWKQWIQTRQSIFHISTPVSTSAVSQIKVQTTDSAVSVSNSSSSVKKTSYFRSGIPQSTIQAQVTAIRPRQSVHTITTDLVDIFKIGVQNTTAKTSLRFVESVLLDQATFRLFSNTGIAEDVRNLELDIAGSTANFDADGSVTVQFHNTRISRGDSLEFNASVRIKDPSTTPHIPGTFRLRIERMTAIGESSNKTISVQVRGTTNSSNIVFDPVSTLTGGDSSISGNTYIQISGGTLAAGEEEYVLGANFSAYYDDLSIRDITLRNTLTGSDIDPFVSRVSAIDLQTGKVLATGRFSNGAVTLHLSPRVFVGRNQQARLGFKVTVADPVPRSSLDARFKLDVLPADLVVESKTTGRELPDSNKNFSIDSQEFAVSQGRMTIAAAGTQTSFAVDTNTPETVFRFMANGGPSDSAIGRISLEVYPSGCTFGGGSLDAGDVSLVRVNGSQQYAESATITASGNKITFDFPTEFYLSMNNSVQFGLQLKLDDVSGNNDSDSIAVKILGDGVYNNGTLSSVRSSGANFIWSDTSARMHSTTTTDWFSGYLVSGLPSNTVVVKRFGN